MTELITPVPEATHYGIAVTHIGEDGDMIAFGHYEPRRALAAFNRHARVFCGLANVVDDRRAIAEDLLAQIGHGWGQFRKPIADEGDDPDWEWVMDSCSEGDPGATAYTRLRAL